MFPGDEHDTLRHRLADNLRATISQRLVPRKDGHGLCAACEIMIVTPTVSDFLRQAEPPSRLFDLIREGNRTYGMQTFNQHLMQMVRAEWITYETGLRAATNPDDFQRAMEFD